MAETVEASGSEPDGRTSDTGTTIEGDPRAAGTFDVSREHARSLITGQFPALAPVRIEPFGGGWDNTAYLVDGGIVFRFPRRAAAAALIATEIRVLPVLAARLPLRIPVPEWSGEPTGDYPWPFAGHRLVPGRTATAVSLPVADRTRAAPAIGEFLAALHAQEIAGYDVPGDTIARLEFGSRLPVLAERLRVLEHRGVIRDGRPWLDLFDTDPGVEPPVAPTLVHGDFYASHLVVDDRSRVTGVIDWGDVHAGDTAVDLMVLYEFLPPAARTRLLDAYGSVAERTLIVARLRATVHAVAMTWWGTETGDADLVREGSLALRLVLED